MSKKKLNLGELKLQSFLTSVEKDKIKGGGGTMDITCTFGGGNVTSQTADCCNGPGNTGDTCDSVRCATQEQSCDATCDYTVDGSATCTPGQNGC